MTARIRFERSAMMSLAHLQTDEDDTHCIVFCSIPGGTPRFAFSPKSRDSIAVDGAPTIETDKQFRAFVTERFGR